MFLYFMIKVILIFNIQEFMFVATYEPITINGNKCVIPFVYKNKVYHDCTNSGSQETWCYIDSEFTKWEYCQRPPKEFQGCRLDSPDITLSEVATILDVHNAFRATIPALRMRKLTWNSELAQRAQAAANNCFYNHTETRQCNKTREAGQNLYYSYSTDDYPKELSWEFIIGEWFNEKPFYNEKNMKCYDKKNCGHYVQVVSDRTALIGCGKAKCLERNEINKYSVQYYCNYFPKDIGFGERIFIKSKDERCKDCYKFDDKERFRCDEKNLCETCDSSMTGCTGMGDIKKLVDLGNYCEDTNNNCRLNAHLCKLRTLPFSVREVVKHCKKTCGICH